MLQEASTASPQRNSRPPQQRANGRAGRQRSETSSQPSPRKGACTIRYSSTYAIHFGSSAAVRRHEWNSSCARAGFCQIPSLTNICVSALCRQIQAMHRHTPSRPGRYGPIAAVAHPSMLSLILITPRDPLSPPQQQETEALAPLLPQVRRSILSCTHTHADDLQGFLRQAPARPPSSTRPTSDPLAIRGLQHVAQRLLLEQEQEASLRRERVALMLAVQERVCSAACAFISNLLPESHRCAANIRATPSLACCATLPGRKHVHAP